MGSIRKHEQKVLDLQNPDNRLKDIELMKKDLSELRSLISQLSNAGVKQNEPIGTI